MSTDLLNDSQLFCSKFNSVSNRCLMASTNFKWACHVQGGCSINTHVKDSQMGGFEAPG